MWFDGIRRPDTLYVANTSRGKDSTAMLRAIQLMGWPLDMICSVDIWATQDIPAELPPMVKFKDEYDQKVLDWFGVPVTRLCATKREREREKLCYGDMFYTEHESGSKTGEIYGWPMQLSPYCRKLKSEKVDLRGHILSETHSRERERELRRGRNGSGEFRIYGFPMRFGNWCNGLKRSALSASRIFDAGGVPANSSRRHQGLSVAKGGLVPGQAQRLSLTSPGTRGGR